MQESAAIMGMLLVLLVVINFNAHAILQIYTHIAYVNIAMNA